MVSQINYIGDIFTKYVSEKSTWSVFTPSQLPQTLFDERTLNWFIKSDWSTNTDHARTDWSVNTDHARTDWSCEHKPHTRAYVIILMRAYTHKVGHTGSESAQHFWLGKTHYVFSCAHDGIRTRVMQREVRRSTTGATRPPDWHECVDYTDALKTRTGSRW